LLNTLQTEGVDFGINLLIALAIFYFGKMVISLIVRGMRKVMQRQEVDKTLETFVCNLVRIVLLVVVIIAAIGQIGIQTTSFIAIFGAAGLAVGLALQGSLSNFAAGVMLLAFRPFKVGDFIDAGGTAGTVREIQLFTSILATPDNVKVIVPNGAVFGGTIKNFAGYDTRRVDLVIGIGYDSPIQKAKEIMAALIEKDERTLSDPPMQIAVAELADSSVNFVVRMWVKREDYWGVKFDMTHAIKDAFDEAGIEIPFPQRVIHQASAA